MTLENAQEIVEKAEVFLEKSNKTIEYIDAQNYSESRSISKDEFVNVMEVLLTSFNFKPTWSDYSALWDSYENDLGSRMENMDDPEVLKKYLKELTQEFIW
eukprot:CAMPEP_0205807512 /NCGR_PEP_ID=MMETSP0205-20121125/11244_1 /ASSEMBLY_ACC=CAM_ASM_000278 /TAXON_ID=36767 /ORGANISM="Euplotes focardii, Strain TN1" /LENGTH=100 /DNA_ID=CAMNT_0053081821 /DNA_START=39 /DNA_END=338 /DNA_ORIENTATION=+